MAVAYLGVGSNIDPVRNVPRAWDALSAREVRIVATSRFYRTEAIDRPEQAPYANGVWQVDFEAGPRSLKKILREVEKEVGRVRTTDKFAARTIDLDILLFGELLLDDGEQRIPDPQILERSFVSVALLELAPDLGIPGTPTSLRELLSPDRPQLEEYPEITRILRTKLEAR